MRATVLGLLLADGALTAVIPSERWFQAGNVLDSPEKPFAVLRWLAPVAGNASGSFAHQLRVDIHDRRGGYKRIDQLLGGPFRSGGVYAILSGILGVSGPDGYVAQADYLGDSGDQEDLDYRSNYKFSSWQILGRTTS
jgi:hypothetical protein